MTLLGIGALGGWLSSTARTERAVPDSVEPEPVAEREPVDSDALLNAGIHALEANDPERAAQHFSAILERDPTNVSATYDLALCADRLGHYHDAREGYLSTLRLDRSHADARYNLALLTYRAGALPEARHHADELEAIAPNDPRLGALRESLSLELVPPSD